MLVYQVITNDKFELPVFQCDTIEEMAVFLQDTCAHVKRSIDKEWTIRNRKFRVIKFDLDEDDE